MFVFWAGCNFELGDGMPSTCALQLLRMLKFATVRTIVDTNNRYDQDQVRVVGQQLAHIILHNAFY